MRIQFTDSFVQLNISALTQSTDVTNIVLHQCYPWIINLESRWDSPNNPDDAIPEIKKVIVHV